MPGLREPEALALLQKQTSSDGESVFDRLTQMVARILEEKPDKAVDLLETALLAKAPRSGPKAHLPLHQEAADTSEMKALVALFRDVETPLDPETGEPLETDRPNEFECEDMGTAAALLEAAGVGLGRSEMLRVALALKQLGESPQHGLASVRFFGKVLCTHGAYYVFEAVPKEQPEPVEAEAAPGPAVVPPEAPGAGANANVYYVASRLGGPLTRLPDVTPQQIKVARQVKRLLTGQLDAEVSAYPPYPGTESVYLRAQIARITSATTLCPAGMFAADEEGAVTRAEEFSPLPGTECASPAAWSHRTAHLKKQGRCVVHVAEAPEGEEHEPTEEEAEAGPEALCTVDKDAEVKGGPAWTPLTSSSCLSVKHQVCGLRSNAWPGAAAVALGAAYTNIYVGWAVKNAPFVPLPPPPVALEFPLELVMSNELPLKQEPVKEAEEGEEGEGEGEE